MNHQTNRRKETAGRDNHSHLCCLISYVINLLWWEESYRHSSIRIWCFCRQALSYKNDKMQQLSSFLLNFNISNFAALRYSLRAELSIEVYHVQFSEK